MHKKVCNIQEDVAKPGNHESMRDLKKIRSNIFNYLISHYQDCLADGELKKTYIEAVKCYLEIDTRIDEKNTRKSGSVLTRWEEIVQRVRDEG